MKKINNYIAVICITAFFIFIFQKPNIRNSESQGIFISYIEYLTYFQNKNNDEIEKTIDTIINNVSQNNLNRIYLQVRAFSDSIYDSDIFPFSHTISGKQGKEIGIDILSLFIEKSHKENIEVYAWINPYRISNYTDTNFISEDNPAYQYLNTNHVKIIENKGIYYNPASKIVKELIVDGVEEIISNYKVDGILLDDYFYPDDTIDLDNYEEVKNTISLTDFRLSNVNELVKNIYKKIKDVNPKIKFGISPDANIANNYSIHYCDVKKWLSEEGYIDYIMPQIYYGFLHEDKPFIKTLNEWNDLIKNNVELIPALALYKINNIDEYAKSGKEEWLENTDIIDKQIKVSRRSSKYKGYSLFRYEHLIKKQSKK